MMQMLSRFFVPKKLIAVLLALLVVIGSIFLFQKFSSSSDEASAQDLPALLPTSPVDLRQIFRWSTVIFSLLPSLNSAILGTVPSVSALLLLWMDLSSHSPMER